MSVLLESEDLDGLERELRSMKISDALYASVMGGVRTVLSFGFPRSRPADAVLELQLVKGKLARLEEDYAKLREENARLRLAAGQTSLKFEPTSNRQNRCSARSPPSYI